MIIPQNNFLPFFGDIPFTQSTSQITTVAKTWGATTSLSVPNVFNSTNDTANVLLSDGSHYASSDGSTWTAYTNLKTSAATTSSANPTSNIVKVGSGIYFFAGDNFWHSTDNGYSWTIKKTVLTGLTGTLDLSAEIGAGGYLGFVDSYAKSPSTYSDTFIYAIDKTTYYFESYDYGVTWVFKTLGSYSTAYDSSYGTLSIPFNKTGYYYVSKVYKFGSTPFGNYAAFSNSDSQSWVMPSINTFHNHNLNSGHTASEIGITKQLNDNATNLFLYSDNSPYIVQGTYYTSSTDKPTTPGTNGIRGLPPSTDGTDIRRVRERVVEWGNLVITGTINQKSISIYNGSRWFHRAITHNVGNIVLLYGQSSTKASFLVFDSTSSSKKYTIVSLTF